MDTKQGEATHRYHVMTFGCQMNKNDSERLHGVFRHMGMAHTENPEEADVIMMNSCSVRASAESRIFGFAHNFAKLKKKKPELVVGVTGCMPGRDKDGKMREKLEGVDLYFSIKDMTRLPSMLASVNPAFRVMEDLDKDYLKLHPAYKQSFQSFVTIQTGCNMFCAYCVVPYARGLEVNRSLKDILEEVRALALHGTVEVTLLGQIVNHYIAPDPEHFSKKNPYKKNDFAKVLWEINQVPGIERIHFTAPHPLYMDDEAIDALTLPKQVNCIHLPMQSGSSEILARMNRRHTRETYLEVVKKIREKVPSIAIATDIIVGFSGETEAHFAETLSAYRICDFDVSYHAQYSVRSGTLGPKLYKDDVSKEDKKERWQRLQALMEETTKRKNALLLGTNVSVLVDTVEGEWCTGNSREMKRVRFKGGVEHLGTIQEVRITKPDIWMLFGSRVSKKGVYA